MQQTVNLRQVHKHAGNIKSKTKNMVDDFGHTF